MATLIPLEDHILIEPVVEDSVTTGGFILPDDDKEKPSRGRVVATGQGKILENGSRAPIDVKEGDIVHFTKYSPDEVQLGVGNEKKTYLIVKHSSILAVEAA